jgi:hypothetical protein
MLRELRTVTKPENSKYLDEAEGDYIRMQKVLDTLLLAEETKKAGSIGTEKDFATEKDSGSALALFSELENNQLWKPSKE